VVGPGDQTEPAIASPYVPFTDEAPGPGAWRIGVYSFTDGSIQYVPGGAGARHLPSISRQILAFVEEASGYGQVWTYDLIGGALTRISPTAADQSHPAVGTDIVFWEDARAGRNDIWLRDFVTGDSYAIPDQGVRPRASGKRVVYLDPSARPAVRLYDASLKTLTAIHPGPAGSADVQGNVVAIAVDVSGGPPKPPNYDIVVVSVTGQPIAQLTLPGNQVNPHVSGSWVAFEDQSLSTATNLASRVILWDYTSSPRVLLAPPAGTSLQTLNALEYPRTVYADDRSGNLDIYSYDPTDTSVPPPPPPPDGGTGDGGCHRECDDDDCDEDRDDRREGDGDREHGDHGGERGHRGRDGGGRRDGGDDDCDDRTHRRDGGSECEEAVAIADLAVRREPGAPSAGAVEFELPRDERVSVCIDAAGIASAWVMLNDRVIAGPRSFDSRAVSLVRSASLPAGANRIGAVVASTPGGTLRVRVVGGPASAAWRPGAPELPRPAAGRAEEAGQGCATGPGGLAALAALFAAAAWRRRRGP
jgi:MYXO-CTERM domain-containing protein